MRCRVLSIEHSWGSEVGSEVTVNTFGVLRQGMIVGPTV